MRMTFLVAVVTVLAAGSLALAGASPSPPVGERIAFQSDRDGTADIWIMDADGSDQHPLTRDAAHDVDPSWAPPTAGAVQPIAFASDRGGRFGIWVARSDGTGLRRLTSPDDADDTAPAWSPDGRLIAFSRLRDGDADLFVIAADGSQTRRLTGGAGLDRNPTWSPDGRRIVFSREQDGARRLFATDPSGSQPQRVTDDAADQDHPAVFRFRPREDTSAREAEFVAYDRLSPSGDSEVAAAPLAGGAPADLSASTAQDSGAAWSSTGRRIAFQSTRDGNLEIYVMDGDGRHQTRLTLQPASDANPDWSGAPPVAPAGPAPRIRERSVPQFKLGVHCTRRGNDRRNRLVGSNRDDVICGRDGNDVLLGRRGRDTLIGGPGRDRLFGGPHNDTLTASDGRGGDVVYGGPGYDRAYLDRGDRAIGVEQADR